MIWDLQGFASTIPSTRRNIRTKVAVFLGASYFRAVGMHMNYGLSARGLAIDTYLPTGEEFPYFRKFWIQKPAPDAKEITLYAILDGPSIAGAYQFVIHPGKETVMDVQKHAFPQKNDRTTRHRADDQHVFLRRKHVAAAGGRFPT